MKVERRISRSRWALVACAAFCLTWLATHDARADYDYDYQPSPPPPAPPTAAPSPSPSPCAWPQPCGPGAPSPDRAATATPPERNPNDAKLLSGFRLGYSYSMAYDQPLQSLGGQSLKDKVDMRSPQHFLVGYEAFYRMLGHSWLNVLMIANATVAGFEQGKFYPSANLLIGGEFDNSFQAGVGVHLEPLVGREAHMIVAGGWTPRVGTFYVPVHAFFIPDVDGAHVVGMTTGVTW
jgi:hypothetical protein